VHILKVLVLLEPLLTRLAMRVLPVLLTNTALSAEPSVSRLVLMEPMLTALTMRVSPVVLVGHLLWVIGVGYVLLEPWLSM